MISSGAAGPLISDFAPGATNLISAFGIPGCQYILERTTNLTPVAWVDISTNEAATDGLINALDTFRDLGGIAPGSAYCRLTWQP